jgi:hypothetical protein
LNGACRYCATFARANTQHVFERGLVPRPEDETATVTFVRFEARTYAVTAMHVIEFFRAEAERDGRAPEGFYVPVGRGVGIQPPFIAAPQNWPDTSPDIALRQVDDGLPARVGKEAFEIRAEKPTYPVPHAKAVGFPTAAKTNRQEPIGTRLAMPCVEAVAEGVVAPESAGTLQFFSELTTKPDIASLSGMSGGPAFWSDGEKFGLLGFVIRALDVTPRQGFDHIYTGPRVNFVVQHASYDTFGLWAEHALREWPKRREELNRIVQRKA